MGNRKVVDRREKLRVALLIAASLAMLMATIHPLAAQEVPANNVTDDSGPPPEQPTSVQESPGEPTTGTPAEPLTAPPEPPPTEVPGQLPAEMPTEPPVGVPGNCDHVAGEFLVGYVSEEALRAAPRENVAETFGGILAQHLVFEDIKNISDPAARLAAEEAKRQELAARSGVAYAEYNCVNQAASAEVAPKSIPSIASCGDCGRTVVEGARRIIADGFEGAGSKGGFNAALDAARSSGAEDNVAFASEAGEDASEDRYSADGTDGEDEDSAATSSDESETDEGAEEGSNGSGADEKADSNSEDEATDGEDATGEGGSSGETASGEDASGEEEDAGAGSSEATPVSGKNVASSSGEPREMSGPGVLALGTGAFLLVAGVFVGRRILQG